MAVCDRKMLAFNRKMVVCDRKIMLVILKSWCLIGNNRVNRKIVAFDAQITSFKKESDY